MGWAAVRRPRGILLPQGAGPAGCTPHCRRRKVRSAPFPPAAKTAPAPLRLLSPPRGARRGPFGLAKRETGRARSKRKDRLDALRRVRASARRGSADRCKRRFWPAFGHAFPFCKFVTAVPWRMVRRSSGWSSHCLCFSFRCRWPSRAGTGATGGCGHPPESINPYDHPGSA